MPVRTEVSGAQALEMLGNAVMRPFTRDDWFAFAGCESKTPMIGEHRNWTIVLDGDTLLVIEDGDDYGGQSFKLTEA